VKNSGAGNSINHGDLKRRLPTIRLLDMDGTLDTAPTGTLTFRLLLKNLSDCLDFQIAVAIEGADGTLFEPTDYPALPGTMQLIPLTNFPDARKLALRPVFQDPTSVTNVNAPLPQAIPFGWNDTAETDEVILDVSIDISQYDSTDITGTLVAQAMVEYNGNWWDVEAVLAAMDQVVFGPGTHKLAKIGTHNAG
jgi:hypothetical protein